MTKEKIYDEKIEPLMASILEICKKHKIAMIADFALDNDGSHCTSALLTGEFEPSENQLAAWGHLKPNQSSGFALSETTETMPDGTKRITIKRIS